MSNSAPPFTTTFELTTNDLVDYLQVAQKTLNTIGMAAGILGIVYGAYLAWLGEVALGAVLALMGVFLFLVSATRYADRLRASSIGKRIVGTQATFTVDDGGIDSSTAAGRTHVSWARVDNLMESPQVMVLRRGRTTVLWLPTRAMGTPAERDAMVDFIRTHVAPSDATRKTAR